MNYRHAFHAGNFADLLKHAVLGALVAELRRDPAPLAIVDTHAGAGAYDLRGELARKTGEAEAGILRLMRTADAPAVFDQLRAAVRSMNAKGDVRYYPGSPILLTEGSRAADTYLGCEIRPDDNAALRIALKGRRGVQITAADGWRTAADQAGRGHERLLVVIDPPFERGDDYARIVATAAAVLERRSAAVVAIWLPIKDLATYDAFLGDLEDAVSPAPLLIAETRLRSLTDPLKMNGCAIAVVRPPADLAASAEPAARWIAEHLGEAGARGGLIRLGA